LAWSLWDWGSIRSKRNQKRFEAQSSEFRSQQIATDLQRDWQKAQEELRLLQESNKWATAVSEQSQNLSRLYYEAYRAGRLNLTDVETANLRWFEAKVQKTRIQAQIYGQWIVLRALIGEEGKS
jgi:outer membrane protein TolC